MGDEDCCRACARFAAVDTEREADPIERAELAVPRGVMLVVRGTGQSVEISAERPVIQVGRTQQGNDLVVPKGNVSRRQMRFLFVDGAVYAEDLKGCLVALSHVDQRSAGPVVVVGTAENRAHHFGSSAARRASSATARSIRRSARAAWSSPVACSWHSCHSSSAMR
jgi:hypothetical protein